MCHDFRLRILTGTWQCDILYVSAETYSAQDRWPRLEQNKENAFKLATLVVFGPWQLLNEVPRSRRAVCLYISLPMNLRAVGKVSLDSSVSKTERSRRCQVAPIFLVSLSSSRSLATYVGIPVAYIHGDRVAEAVLRRHIRVVVPIVSGRSATYVGCWQAWYDSATCGFLWRSGYAECGEVLLCTFSSLLTRQIWCSSFRPLSLPLLLAVLACCQAASWSGTASGVLLAGASLRNTFESRVHLDKQHHLQRILSLRTNTAKRSDLRHGRPSTIWVLGAVSRRSLETD